MDYTSEIKELYFHTKYLEPKQFQINIMNSIMNNIEQGKKMQAIKMPNATGKTVMCNFLAVLLKRKGYKVVIFSPWEASRNPKTKKGKFSSAYLQPEIYNEDFRKEHSEVPCLDYNGIELLEKEDVDIFLTDAIGSVLDLSVDVLHPEKYLQDNIDEDNMSYGQRELKSIYHIQKLVKEKTDISIVSFEAGHSAIESGFTPIIATDYITCFGISDFDYEQLDSVANEYLMTYNQLLQSKLKNVIKAKEQNVQIEAVTKVDEGITEDISDVKKSLYAIESLLKEKEQSKLQTDVLDIKNSLSQLREEVGDVNDKVSGIAEDVLDIKSIIVSMNKVVTERKQFMDLYFSVHPDDDDESDLMISKFTTMVAEQVVNQGIGNRQKEEFRRMEKMLQLSLGDACWSKMSEESKRFLVTAKYTLYEQIGLEDLGDFSGVCVLASKAFELEMAKRFIAKYKEYIIDDLKLGTQYEVKWPGALLKKSKGVIIPKEIEDFTLGDCKGIMGLRTEREAFRRNNNELFIDYCKKDLLGISNEMEIKNKLKEYDKMIQNVKDKFRNPASHKAPVELALAKECIDYIMEVEKVLGVLLTAFKF